MAAELIIIRPGTALGHCIRPRLRIMCRTVCVCILPLFVMMVFSLRAHVWLGASASGKGAVPHAVPTLQTTTELHKSPHRGESASCVRAGL